MNQRGAAMFRLEVELAVWFVPPMDEHGRGISLLRTFKLPFPPTENCHLTGAAFNPHGPSSEGFGLKGVTWDVDRQLFLAGISLVCHDHPIAFIPDELRAWTGCGWRMGSQDDAYPRPECADEPAGESGVGAEAGDDWEEADRLPTQKPRSRPKAFNKLLRALVREMAALYNNQRVAYAIDRTHLFFTDEQLPAAPTRAREAFTRALAEFDQMSMDEQIKWQEGVTRTHPRLDRVIAES
jgi:hypothetical protein